MEDIEHMDSNEAQNERFLLVDLCNQEIERARRYFKAENSSKVTRLRLLLKNKDQFITNLGRDKDKNYDLALIYKSKYESLCIEYEKLGNKFERNFKFHRYIKNVLDQTADLMENYNVRK